MSGRSGFDPQLEMALRAGAGPPAGLASRVLGFVREAAEDLARLPELDVEATDVGVSRIGFGTGRSRTMSAAARRHVEHAREELAEFFAVERGYFTVPVDLSAARPFQRAVLEAARRIPLGEVRSYRWVAAGAGKESAVRAAGTALRTNPVPLIVPCHRVVRTDGSLGGYAGGLALKRQLLRIEREVPGLVGRVDAKRLCLAGCPEEKGIGESGRVVYSSVEEAQASGYRPCPTCRPGDAPADPGGSSANEFGRAPSST